VLLAPVEFDQPLSHRHTSAGCPAMSDANRFAALSGKSCGERAGGDPELRLIGPIFPGRVLDRNPRNRYIANGAFWRVSPGGTFLQGFSR
jgi:hypothetical protein